MISRAAFCGGNILREGRTGIQSYSTMVVRNCCHEFFVWTTTITAEISWLVNPFFIFYSAVFPLILQCCRSGGNVRTRYQTNWLDDQRIFGEIWTDYAWCCIRVKEQNDENGKVRKMVSKMRFLGWTKQMPKYVQAVSDWRFALWSMWMESEMAAVFPNNEGNIRLSKWANIDYTLYSEYTLIVWF